MQCFLLSANPYPSGSYTWKTCGNTSSLKPRTSSSGIQGVYWEVDGVDMFNGSFVLPSSSVSTVAWNTPSDYGSCESCKSALPEKKYDCINGACLEATTYKTPGLYSSISDCEAICGTGCSGKCISNSDWAQIEGLSGQLKNRNCS